MYIRSLAPIRFLFFVISCCGVITNQAHGTVVLDQSNLPQLSNEMLTIGGRLGVEAAQTFTVGVGGVLDHIDVGVQYLPSDIIFTLHGAAVGIPYDGVLATGMVLASDTLSGLVTIDFQMSDLHVYPGEQLAIEAGPSAYSFFGSTSYWAGQSPGTYAHGEAQSRYMSGVEGAYGYWESGAGSTITPFQPFGDLEFQTFVDNLNSIPSPGALPILPGIFVLMFISFRHNQFTFGLRQRA